EEEKDYVTPALEIIGFDVLVNRANRCCSAERGDYAVTLDSIRRNLRSTWVVDDDPFKVNQLGHPYQGSMYHGFARSSGLSYWEAMVYTLAGSAVWEIVGEKTPPSRNDLIASGVGGSFIGEVLFRLSTLVLEHVQLTPFWRELGAAVVSPATGFNRAAFGDRFKTVFPSHDPVYYSRLQVGFSGTAQNVSGTST